jgi:hypothetical protein
MIGEMRECSIDAEFIKEHSDNRRFFTAGAVQELYAKEF